MLQVIISFRNAGTQSVQVQHSNGVDVCRMIEATKNDWVINKLFSPV